MVEASRGSFENHCRDASLIIVNDLQQNRCRHSTAVMWRYVCRLQGSPQKPVLCGCVDCLCRCLESSAAGLCHHALWMLNFRGLRVSEGVRAEVKHASWCTTLLFQNYLWFFTVLTSCSLRRVCDFHFLFGEVCVDLIVTGRNLNFVSLLSKCNFFLNLLAVQIGAQGARVPIKPRASAPQPANNH